MNKRPTFRKNINTLRAHLVLAVTLRDTGFSGGFVRAVHISGNLQDEISFGKPLTYFDHPVDMPTLAFQERFSEELTKGACRLAALRPTYLVGPLPEMPADVPKLAARRAMLGNPKEIQTSISEYQTRHELVWQAQDAAVKRCGAKVLDPLPFMCEAGSCSGARQGRPLYYDSHHLSEFGNKQLVPMFQLAFQ